MSDTQTSTFEIARPSSSPDGAPWSRRNFPPCVLCIFGGAGDLSHRKLLPALYNLMVDKLLPQKFAIVAFSIEDLNNEKYRAFARDGIEKFSRQKITDENWSQLRTAAALRARQLHQFDRLHQAAPASGRDRQ